MRRGPKFELTQEMVIENIRTVCARIGVTTLTRMLYDEHGSFSYRAIERKWKWAAICQLAGVQSGKAGKPRAVRRTCRECESRVTTRLYYCQVCVNKMRRHSQGAML